MFPIEHGDIPVLLERVYIYISYIFRISNHILNIPFVILQEVNSHLASTNAPERPDWAVPAAARSQLETMGNDTVNARDAQGGRLSEIGQAKLPPKVSNEERGPNACFGYIGDEILPQLCGDYSKPL